MSVIAMSQQDCTELLERVSIGRLACALDNQPYVVPVGFVYEGPNHVYVFSTLGKKIEWMRQNPKVCLQADEVSNRSNWNSVVVNGTYLELAEPQYSSQKQHAIERLGEFSQWWKTPLSERREASDDLSIEPVFFRIDISEVTGLRAQPE